MLILISLWWIPLFSMDFIWTVTYDFNLNINFNTMAVVYNDFHVLRYFAKYRPSLCHTVCCHFLQKELQFIEMMLFIRGNKKITSQITISSTWAEVVDCEESETTPSSDAYHTVLHKRRTYYYSHTCKLSFTTEKLFWNWITSSEIGTTNV